MARVSLPVVLEQQLNQLRRALAGPGERSLALGIRRVGISAGREQQPNAVRVPPDRRAQRQALCRSLDQLALAVYPTPTV
jgi:hypothetical protein